MRGSPRRRPGSTGWFPSARAKAAILAIVDPPKAELGAVYMGRVVNITKFGAFVNILPGRDGLLHISKIGGGKRIDKVLASHDSSRREA